MATAVTDIVLERFHQLGRRWIDDAYVVKPSKVPNIVYHYTDAAGLAGMLRTHAVWATDYRFLNDKSEIGHTTKMVRCIIEERLASTDDDMLQEFYRCILDKQDSASMNLFIFSLSCEEDDLSQWRGYARDGQGFTVGFCGKSINDASGPEAEYSFLQVEYDEKTQEQIVIKTVDEFEKELRKATVDDGHGMPRNICELGAIHFNWVFNNRSSVNKHKSFKLENEWRMVGYIDETEKPEDIKVRVSGLRLIRYTEFRPRFPDRPILPIKSIGVGPGFTGAEQFDAVRSLCMETGYDVEIYNADTPYRRVGA